MDITTLGVIMLASAFIGGGLGAHLASASFWKGAVSSLIAVVLQVVIAIFFGIDNLLIHFVIYLIMLGLVGGRLMMKLSARTLTSVALGTLLIPALAVLMIDVGVQSTR